MAELEYRAPVGALLWHTCTEIRFKLRFIKIENTVNSLPKINVQMINTFNNKAIQANSHSELLNTHTRRPTNKN